MQQRHKPYRPLSPSLAGIKNNTHMVVETDVTEETKEKSGVDNLVVATAQQRLKPYRLLSPSLAGIKNNTHMVVETDITKET